MDTQNKSFNREITPPENTRDKGTFNEHPLFPMAVSALRFAVFILTHTIYRLKICGKENIPQSGPALIVSNHVSFIDAILILSSTSRYVRCMIDPDIYNHPLLRFFCKWMGFIEIDVSGTSGKAEYCMERARQSLRNGELLCIFPEGKITTNGIMNEFRDLAKSFLPDDLDIPFIPVYLGRVWGSIFSYYFGKVKLRGPGEFPYSATVTIGRTVHKGTPPYKLRSIIAELAASSEELPRNGEKTLHHKFISMAKRHPFRKNI